MSSSPYCTIWLDRLYLQQKEPMVEFQVSWGTEQACGSRRYLFKADKAIEILKAAGEKTHASLLEREATALVQAQNDFTSRITSFFTGVFKSKSNLPKQFDHFSIFRQGNNYDFEYGCDPFALILGEHEEKALKH